MWKKFHFLFFGETNLDNNKKGEATLADCLSSFFIGWL